MPDGLPVRIPRQRWSWFVGRVVGACGAGRGAAHSPARPYSDPHCYHCCRHCCCHRCHPGASTATTHSWASACSRSPTTATPTAAGVAGAGAPAALPLTPAGATKVTVTEVPMWHHVAQTWARRAAPAPSSSSHQKARQQPGPPAAAPPRGRPAALMAWRLQRQEASGRMARQLLAVAGTALQERVRARRRSGLSRHRLRHRSPRCLARPSTTTTLKWPAGSWGSGPWGLHSHRWSRRAQGNERMTAARSSRMTAVQRPAAAGARARQPQGRPPMRLLLAPLVARQAGLPLASATSSPRGSRCQARS